MSKQPLKKEDVDSSFLSEQYLSLDKSDIGTFRARRFFQIAEEYYNKYPDNINISYFFSCAFFMMNKNNEGIEFFKYRILPLTSINNPHEYLQQYSRLATFLYINKDYKEALKVIEELEKIPEKKSSPRFIVFSIPIYFENKLYKKMFDNIQLFPTYLGLNDFASKVYLSFYYYYIGDYKLLNEQIESMVLMIGLNKLDNSNINILFEQITKTLVQQIEKNGLSDLENEFLDNIRKIVLMNISYKQEEISFTENILFHDNKYVMQVERCEEGGFYGKIPSIDGCYTQAETLEELKDNILEVLDLYIEDELIKG